MAKRVCISSNISEKISQLLESFDTKKQVRISSCMKLLLLFLTILEKLLMKNTFIMILIWKKYILPSEFGLGDFGRKLPFKVALTPASSWEHVYGEMAYYTQTDVEISY